MFSVAYFSETGFGCVDPLQQCTPLGILDFRGAGEFMGFAFHLHHQGPGFSGKGITQFRDRIPQYMRRHRVKSGITGWAQVNGWRGNTSIEKRIEHDIYYIENWSLLLDFKILILTLFRGFGQKHAY
jgi:hypothetical protein